jgi:hypothetical protein
MFTLQTKNKFRFVALALTLGTVAVASADEVHLAGSTLGQFDAQFAAEHVLQQFDLR